MTKIKKEAGIYKNVPFEEYLNWDCFSKSMVPATLRSTAHLHQYIQKGISPTPAMGFGSLVDAIMTEPEMFASKYVKQLETYPDKNDVEKKWNNNATFCKNWNLEQAAQDLIIFKEEDYQKALEIVLNIQSHDTAKKWIKDAEFQVSIVWKDEETGVMCKARFDFLQTDGITDLKTTGDASPTEFQRTLNKFSYHVQNVSYVDGYKTLTGKELPFRFVVAESSAPHCVAAYTLGPESLRIGRAIYRRAIRLYSEYVDHGPAGYSSFEQQIEIPPWAVYAEDDIDFDESLLGEA